MWSPTHVQVLVLQAKSLNIKGKHGTNDAFATISLGKEKFQTSVIEKSSDLVEWNEQCELSIPSHGNTAEVHITVQHRNFLGVDEFLGQISLPLKEFDVYERPKSKWFPLKCKTGQTKTDYRGELMVKIGFTVKATNPTSGSVADLRTKSKGSISSLSKVGGSISGSLMSLSSKEKRNIKQFAKSISQKVGKSKRSSSNLNLSKKDRGGLESLPESGRWSEETENNQDPGVNSDEEEEVNFDFERLSNQSINRATGADKSIFTENQEELQNQTAAKFDMKRPEIMERVSSESSTLIKDDVIKNTQNSQKGQGNTELQSGLPSYDEVVHNKQRSTPGKRKIIPVEEEDSSSSPATPSSPASPTTPSFIQRRVRQSQSSFNLSKDTSQIEKKKQSLGLKLKSSYTFANRDELEKDVAKEDHENCSQIISDKEENWPKEVRIVAGREAVPDSHLPHEILARYNGKTREDLIEMLVNLQTTTDLQARKIVDLEDYIDNLLIRVLEVAPILLKKDSPMENKNYI